MPRDITKPIVDETEAEKRERVRKSHVKAIQVAGRARELTEPLVEMAYEAASAREWLCPKHGPVGLAVNLLSRCVAVKSSNRETHEEILCDEPCTHDGPLMRTPKEIAVVLSTFARQAASQDIVKQDLGVSKLPALTFNDNRKIEQHAALPLWLYDMLTSDQKSAYAARVASHMVDHERAIDAKAVEASVE